VIPALKNRKEDIPVLAQHFVHQSCESNNLSAKTLSQGALRALMSYDWPGNIRQLQNAIEHAVAMSGDATEIRPDLLPEEVIAQVGPVATATSVTLPSTPEEGINFASMMSQMERELILRYLRKAGGNKRQAARLLSLSRTTLIDKLHRLGVSDSSAA
jgi:DNA-binding NtrC family response regulator